MKEKVMVGRGNRARMWDMRCTFGSSKVDYIAIFFEHVDLFNRLNGLDVELFQRCL